MKFEYLVERAVPKYGIYDPELGNPASLTLLTPMVGYFFWVRGKNFLKRSILQDGLISNPSRQGQTREETWESTTRNCRIDMEYFSVRDNLSTIITGWQDNQLRHYIIAMLGWKYSNRSPFQLGHCQ